MELWIRSQDKRVLQKVNNLYLNSNYSDKEVFTWDSDECQTRLGIYESKERALEVLDEIQRRIEYINNVDNDTFTECVYQMPDE